MRGIELNYYPIDAVAGWLSEVLGTPSRLVRVPPEHDRVTSGQTPGTAGYADSSPLLVTSLSSLDVLNERIAQRGGEPLPMNRFRPNVVVGGWDEPHIKDRARRINAGDAELGYAKLAIRCVVTTVDQESGTKAGPEPLRTLAGYRRAAEGGVAFGVKFAVVRPGKLSVDDEVIVSSWAESELSPGSSSGRNSALSPRVMKPTRSSTCRCLPAWECPAKREQDPRETRT